jgi:hypothetical protein
MVESSARVATTSPASDKSMKPKTPIFTAAAIGVSKRALGHGKVLAGLGPSRRTDSIRWVLALPAWHGRILDVFVLAVHHLTRLVTA